MRTLNRFWQSLEARIGCAAVAEEWRILTAGEFPLVRRFLRATGELATSYPHPNPAVCAWRVVTHGPDDHVGVCEETEQTIALATEELIVYGLDTLALEAALVAAFGFEPEEQPRAWHPKDHRRIGHFVPVAGFRFAVYLVIPSLLTGLLPKICRIVGEEQEPFLLFAPTRRRFTEDCAQLLRRQGACFLPLAESVCVGDDGRLVPSEAGQRVIAEFRRQVVPESQMDVERAFFPTPSGAKWSDVWIRLVDGHTASISVGSVHGIYNFAAMGMANRKNSTPTVQWELLRQFAAGHGVLTWRSAGADRKNKKRRENLAQDLKAFFRIDGDPFTRYESGWRTRFHLDPDH